MRRDFAAAALLLAWTFATALLPSTAAAQMQLSGQDKPKQEKEDAPASSGRTAAQILADYNKIKLPEPDRQKLQRDREYAQTFRRQLGEAMGQRAELAQELFQNHPAHSRVPEVMNERWTYLLDYAEKPDVVVEETGKYLESNPKLPPAVKSRVLFARAAGLVESRDSDLTQARTAVDEAIASKPDEPRGATLLLQLSQRTTDPEGKKALMQRVVDNYPKAPQAQRVRGQLKRLDAVGKPFELAFNDAVTNQRVDMKSLRGKVVVVDFWATWCGPCVAEMPHMKEIYAKYKDQGVEFIGVSLDQPGDGLQKLRTFVKEQQIAWPQYYQGKGWQSEFSSGWGINSIPAIFIVNADGNLHSTEARGRVEELIKELIAKRDGKPS